SLRMGFQTLAIEQQAAEVWRVLGAVKSEFAKFGEVLDRVKKQLDTASRTIEKTGARTRAMERKLRSVEQLSDEESVAVLGAADLLEPAGPEGEVEAENGAGPDDEVEQDEGGESDEDREA
ncbi:MAG: DNA recombination protein RmuC, partial [Actinomycetes bacterium]